VWVFPTAQPDAARAAVRIEAEARRCVTRCMTISLGAEVTERFESIPGSTASMTLDEPAPATA
jgi:hypothetical protein